MKINFAKGTILSALGVSFLMSSLSFGALTQSFDKDRSAIKAMTGCYDVTFQNAETFSPLKDYAFHDRFSTKGLEWIFVNEETDKMISLQHLLITPVGIVKHWRQAWSYEDPIAYEFSPPLIWEKHSFPWEKTQVVFRKPIFLLCTGLWILQIVFS